MPPGGADGEPDDHVDGDDDEAELPPFALRDVAGAVEDGGRAVTMQLEMAVPSEEKPQTISPALDASEELELLRALKGKIKKLSR